MPTQSRKHSTVSSTSCSLSSSGSTFEYDYDCKPKRIPIGNGERQKFLFSRIGSLDSKNDSLSGHHERKLGITLLDDKYLIDAHYMKRDERKRAELGKAVYWCADKKLIYSAGTFNDKKASSTRVSKLPRPTSSPSAASRTPKHAYIKYWERRQCKCGGLERPHAPGECLGEWAATEVQLTGTMDAVLPHYDGKKLVHGHIVKYLEPAAWPDVRIRDLASGQTKVFSIESIDHDVGDDLKKGQKLWYSAIKKKFFTEQYVKDHLITAPTAASS